MFDVGSGELFLILVIALLILGPERLPEAARTVGRWTGRAKALFNNLRDELEREAYNKELKEKFDEQMRAMGLDPNDLKEVGKTPSEFMKDAAASSQRADDADNLATPDDANGTQSADSAAPASNSTATDKRPADHD